MNIEISIKAKEENLSLRLEKRKKTKILRKTFYSNEIGNYKMLSESMLRRCSCNKCELLELETYSANLFEHRTATVKIKNNLT